MKRKQPTPWWASISSKQSFEFEDKGWTKILALLPDLPNEECRELRKRLERRCIDYLHWRRIEGAKTVEQWKCLKAIHRAHTWALKALDIKTAGELYIKGKLDVRKLLPCIEKLIDDMKPRQGRPGISEELESLVWDLIQIWCELNPGKKFTHNPYPQKQQGELPKDRYRRGVGAPQSASEQFVYSIIHAADSKVRGNTISTTISLILESWGGIEEPSKRTGS
jgi:hypothetical protein